MRRFAAAAALLALALGAGTASADTFAVVPESFVAVPAGPVVLPSAEVPNAAGSILLPPGAWESAFLPVRELSYEELQALWVHAAAAYGVPWQVLAAINKIESNFGRNMGPSSAGAVGWMQFMPDTWLRWGTDGNGDGLADPWNPEDAIPSAARYLAAANGRTDISRAIFAYNHAQWYVDDVLQLAAMFGGDLAGADAVFSLDRMALALEEAQEQVASLAEQLAAAEALESESAAKSERLTAAADDLEQLLSDRVLAEKDAFQAGQERAATTAEADRLRSELEQAQTALEAARSGAESAAFAPAAAGVLRMPTRADGYVFPVGGGPGVVSVGHQHHDYPAADIAAPLGAPLYALADGVVLSVVDDGRCGTGLVLRTLDGLEWVYCHLSYRDPGLEQGSLLSAGQWVGLVGSTGHSTGPHLHLGLRPARYPQEMPWFQEFAGIAFMWQDGPAETDVRTTPVFALVPPEEPAGDVVEFTLSGG
ncbi:MAG TPA: lytic murein transglycosylase [Gaiellaceae bacterium]|nr:lytic murein transglycosylase [Gaiellaceae bacterium]